MRKDVPPSVPPSVEGRDAYDVELLRRMSPKARALLLKKLGKKVPKDVRDALKEPKKEEGQRAKDEGRTTKDEKRITKGEQTPTAFNLPSTTYQPLPITSNLPPTTSFSERLEELRLDIKKRLARRREERRLARLASEVSVSSGDSVQRIIDSLPDEVKRKLGKRKR